MLYYLKVEVLGDAASEALEGVSARYGTADVWRLLSSVGGRVDNCLCLT